MSLRRKKKNKHNIPTNDIETDKVGLEAGITTASNSLTRLRIRNDSHSSHSDCSGSSPSTSRRRSRNVHNDIEMCIKNVEVLDDRTTIQTVEVLKRPGQTLGIYIREGDGKSVKRGVFISRIAEGSVVQRNGLLKVGDEIQSINSVNIKKIIVDEVVVLMSIPERLILKIKSRHHPFAAQRSMSSNSDIDTRKQVFVQKQYSEESAESSQQSKLAIDINTEDSNDSGLSSENSAKCDKYQDFQSHYSNLQPPAHYGYPQPNTSEPLYARPKPVKSELYVSDGEHEYNCQQKTCINPYASTYKHSKQMHKRQAENNYDAYNSDSELLPKFSPAAASEQFQQPINVYSDNDRGSVKSENSYSSYAKPPRFSLEMQNWLRKYNASSGECQSKTDQQAVPDTIPAAQELDGYRDELWRQEKLINDAIHNMESALNVDAMLQQSTYSSMPKPEPSSQTMNADYNTLPLQNSTTTFAYSYLRDLPLLIRSPMKLKIEDFQLYRPDYDRIIEKDVLANGTMKLTIYCGHGLKSSRTSLRDLYCVVQLDNYKRVKTIIRTGAINFDWDESFDLNIQDGTKKLSCMIYLWDPILRHSLCFTGTIQLANIFDKASNKTQNHKCALRLEPRGILYLEITYRQDSSMSTTSSNGAIHRFGKLPREMPTLSTTQTSVPLIIQKCVREVENRGMLVVGIYRINSPVKKKQELHKQLLSQPQSIDLSPANVPEIHAVTGLLKDYLRELPNSLLTEESYEVAGRALAKVTKQDADLDCIEIVNEFVAKLHPRQQGTVVFLLNHLKRVSLYHEENKMSTTNLAVIFAPIFVPSTHPEHGKTEDVNSMRVHIDITKCILDIWPENYSTNNNIVV